MKVWLAAFTLTGLICLLALAHSTAANMPANKTEADFQKMEQNWLDAAAVPDLPALRKMLADDFMGTSFGGDVLSKSDVVPADGSTANHMPKCSLRDSTVRLFGDTAVLMGYVEMQAADKKQGMRMTTVFQKRGEGWQVIAVHMSRTPEGSA
jgi:ketosteroid isomerase-like protein